MKKIIVCSFIFFVLAAFGCLPAQKRPVALPSGPNGLFPPPAFSDAIDEKIRFHNMLLQKNDLSSEDKKIASDLLSTYQELQRLSSTHSTEAHYQNIIHDLFRRLSSIDERYFSIKQGDVVGYSKTISLFADKRDDILGSYLSGDFKRVIDLCIELNTEFGPDALTPDIGLLFALSLANKEMLKEAINIGEGIAREMAARPDIVQLRAKIAEWYLQQGQREKAISVYEKLADALDEQGIIVQSLSRKIVAQEKTGSALGTIPGQVQSHRTEGTVDHLLEKVDQLLEENRFSEARDLLLLKRKETLSTNDNEAIIQALKRLELAEENYLEKKITALSTKKDMVQAQRLLEEERFEEVISKLEALESEQEDNRELIELKQFAIEKLINRERNRAAKIFLSAKEIQDPEKRKEYLHESHEILKSLADRYPLSPLNSRLKSHMKIVEDELDKLKKDPE